MADKYILITPLENSEGEPWLMPAVLEWGEKGEMPFTVVRAVRVLLLVVQNQLNAGKMEMADVGHGAVVLRLCRRAISEQRFYLTLAQDDYDWLVKFADTWGSKVYGFNYIAVKEALAKTLSEAERKTALAKPVEAAIDAALAEVPSK